MYRHKKHQGFTLVELLITLGIFGIVMGIAAMNLRPLSGDLQAAGSEVVGTFKQTRARAMVTTSAYRIVPTSADTLDVQRATRCSSSNWTDDTRLGRTLREGVTLALTDWQVCFSPRGLTNNGPTFDLKDKDGKILTVQVFLGGMVELR